MIWTKEVIAFLSTTISQSFPDDYKKKKDFASANYFWRISSLWLLLPHTSPFWCDTRYQTYKNQHNKRTVFYFTRWSIKFVALMLLGPQWNEKATHYVGKRQPNNKENQQSTSTQNVHLNKFIQSHAKYRSKDSFFLACYDKHGTKAFFFQIWWISNIILHSRGQFWF